MTGRKSWFNMAPKRRSSETDQQVIKRGSLMKSPPSYLFNNRTSWKRRLFKFCKTLTDSYIISYYHYDGLTENWKGDIYVGDIKAIELGTNMMDKNISAITRLFNTSSDNVLYIKTESRIYFLLDDNVNTIAEWQRCITDVWVQINQRNSVTGPRISHAVPLQSMINKEEGARRKSYPEQHSSNKQSLDEALERQRSHTDPQPQTVSQTNFGDYRGLFPRNSVEQPDGSQDRKRSLTHSEHVPDWTPIITEIRRLSITSSDQQDPVSSRPSDDNTDGASDSGTESIYDTPRPISMSKHESWDSADQEDSDSSEENIYEIMDSVEVKCCPAKPPRNSRTTEPHRYRKTQGSQLKKAYILKMWYEQDNQCDLEKINITIPAEHLKNYLGLQEVGERLCVSKWKGPAEIGCVFHHGDHIDAFNGVRLRSKDLFFQMLNNYFEAEVNLVLFRNKKADIFHVEGCSCDMFLSAL
ncbi:pleckstrin homology domain-containing family S member 1-like isoform X2 [Mixophyes fleayi]|uniref:pleckstrin homology domain-containing family S member 1-like isoform X2 n=1 Tax=Mixophyes fleayi TaxID=3061075 RepID=UPI003F4D9FAE